MGFTLDTRGVLVQESARGVRAGARLRRDLQRAGNVPVASVHVGVAFMWACVSAGDEFETGLSDAQTPRDHGIARLGVPASTAPSIAMAESQLSLEDAASPNAGLEKVTDGGR